MSFGKRILEIIRNNKLTCIYALLLSVLPLCFSSYIIYLMTEYSYFFKGLYWVDICTLFSFLTLTMAFALTPTTFICFLSGFLWGWQSLLYILPSYILAQSLGFLIAKKLDGNRLLNYLRTMNKMPGFLDNVENNQAKIIFLSRLSPVLPFALMNMVLSILQVSFKKFIVFGFLGMLPRTIFVVWLGSQAQDLAQGLGENLYYKIALFVLTILTVWGMGKVLSSGFHSKPSSSKKVGL